MERNLALFGIAPPEARRYDLELYPPSIDEASEKLRQFLSTSNGFVLLVPGSSWNTKRWHWEHYRELARRLVRSGQHVVISGAPAERELVDKISAGLSVTSFAGDLKLQDMLLLLSRAMAVVCNDSSALHMASAFQIPTVAIFCATSPAFGFGPWRNPSARTVEKQGLSCKPCSRHGTQHCPLGTEACMREVSIDEVLGELASVCPRLADYISGGVPHE